MPPPIRTSTQPSNPGLVLGLVALMLILTTVLFLFNPVQYGFYPVCLFYKITGWQCPGCGSLRALHQLLHGHILEALRFNALLVVSLPALSWLGLRTAHALLGASYKPMVIKPVWVWAILAVILLFGVLRNVRF